MKQCPHCGERKVRDAFGSDRSQSDGLAVYCRPCQQQKQREYRARHPERVQAQNKRRRAVKREWERNWLASDASRAACSQCGQLCGAGSARPSATPSICEACRHDEYDRKARKVEKLWNEGKTFPEIQAAMGWTKNMLGRMMDQYREDGYDLPYRYRSQRGHKYPAQGMAA